MPAGMATANERRREPLERRIPGDAEKSATRTATPTSPNGADAASGIDERVRAMDYHARDFANNAVMILDSNILHHANDCPVLALH